MFVCWPLPEKLDFPKIPDGMDLGMWKYEINLVPLNKKTDIWLFGMP